MVRPAHHKRTQKGAAAKVNPPAAHVKAVRLYDGLRRTQKSKVVAEFRAVYGATPRTFFMYLAYTSDPGERFAPWLTAYIKQNF